MQVTDKNDFQYHQSTIMVFTDNYILNYINHWKCYHGNHGNW